MKVAVIGSRSLYVNDLENYLPKETTEIVSGGAIGVDRSARRYAKQNGLLVSGGSDFHYRGHEALCLLRSKEELRTSYDVADALRSKDVIFDCSGHIIIPYIY
jgi:hypothetical protein